MPGWKHKDKKRSKMKFLLNWIISTRFYFSIFNRTARSTYLLVFPILLLHFQFCANYKMTMSDKSLFFLRWRCFHFLKIEIGELLSTFNLKLRVFVLAFFMSSTANAPTMWRRLLVDDVRDVNVNARLVVEWGKIHVYANIKSEEEKKMMMLMDTKKNRILIFFQWGKME